MDCRELDLIENIVDIVEYGLEVKGVKKVDIKPNVIEIEMVNGRALNKLFPNPKDRIFIEERFRNRVQATRGNYIFYCEFEYAHQFLEYLKHFEVANPPAKDEPSEEEAE